MRRTDPDDYWDEFLGNCLFYGGIFCLALFGGVWLFIGAAELLWGIAAGVLLLVLRLYWRPLRGGR